MCFTPAISMTTAVIEFFLAALLLLLFRRSELRNFFAFFIFLLGFYQFSEYMVCSSINPLAWASVGVIIYSFLPALALHSVLKTYRKKISYFLLYVIPSGVILAITVIPNFVFKANCERFFINISTLASQADSPLLLIGYYAYLLYYLGFMVFSCFIIYKEHENQKNKIKQRIEIAQLVGVLLMTVPTFVFIIIFPSLGFRFPSVLCEFAIFVAIAAFIGAYYEDKLDRTNKKK